MSWFHPLVWWSARRMRLERERACDCCVLLAGQEPSIYASHLLEIAQEHSNPSPLLNGALCMARKSQLEGRLHAVLNSGRCRGRVGAVRTGGIILLAVAFAAVLGLIRPSLQAEELLTPSERYSTQLLLLYLP